MSSSKPTPMLQQYLSIKTQYPDAILFYRMGDFYEMFFEDARQASRLLEITLTSRNKNEADPVPMCGVPYRAAKGYIARLIEQGHKVAICDQVEDSAVAKGLVKREVVRVVTPGMIVEDELLDAKSNNYLLALNQNREMLGLAYLDISTGLFRVVETRLSDKIFEELQRVDPREVLMPDAINADDPLSEVASRMNGRTVNRLEAALFDQRKGRRQLLAQMHTQSLEGFGCEQMSVALGAAGALLHYVAQTQKQAVEHLRRIESYSLEDHLVIDHTSRLNLELEHNIRNGSRQGTLAAVIDHTTTPMGGRMLKQWLRYPLLSPERIGRRLDAVEEAVTNADQRRRLIHSLSQVYDLERLNSKIIMGHANARDLLGLGRSLGKLPEIWDMAAALTSDLYRSSLPLAPLSALSSLIQKAICDEPPPTIHEGGMIRPGYHAELDELIRISRDAKGYLAQLEVRQREATGIATLKVRYNKVFGYYIEVSKAQTKLVPAHYVRKQTLVNAERYITDELKQFENKVLGAEERQCALELTLFEQIRERVRAAGDDLQVAARFVARIDCLLALAQTADQNDYCRPSINTHGTIRIKEGRHPVVERMIRGERFVPNSVTLDDESDQVLVITGPNMAGKSTILRQVALHVIMAQMGGFVPAVSADIGVTDRIFTRVGALDNLSAGQSTFMVEMQETANILNNATRRSLIIMDEIGRGTSTYDGLSIAWAVVEYLHDLKGVGVKTLFATHYHELVELARIKPRVNNFNIAVKEWNDQVIFLRKLVPGGTNRSYGIQVARLAGIPDAVIRKAKIVLTRVENHAPTGSSVAEAGPDTGAAPPAPVQLELFQPVEKEICDRLQHLDLNAITPIEALNLLQHLQERSRGVIGS
ncbi:MAG: DNA mismatch repair protein MutS [Desulfatitalea sp.]|nr:DNA mismatch repair protein MutS [Desulfatitalea sp.]NNK01973.1 DNA mismatch repair protein MutS [Desulfatitalea sp.]